MATRPLFSAVFWLDALERAVKTLAQSVLGVLAGNQLNGALDFAVAKWVVITSVVTSILMSIISTGVGEPGSASLLNPAPPDTLKDNGHGLVETVLIAAAVAVLVFAILIAVSDKLAF